MTYNLIGFAGKAGSGKDTAGHYLVHKYGYYKFNLADRIKHGLNAMFGWTMFDWADREWVERVQLNYGFSPRQASQALGTEFREKVDPSKMLWINLLVNEIITKYPLTADLVCICDVRFPHEQDWIHRTNGIVVYIQREVDGVAEHISETSLDFTKVDYTVANLGTIEEFHKGLDIVMRM